MDVKKFFNLPPKALINCSHICIHSHPNIAYYAFSLFSL